MIGRTAALLIVGLAATVSIVPGMMEANRTVTVETTPPPKSCADNVAHAAARLGIAAKGSDALEIDAIGDEDGCSPDESQACVTGTATELVTWPPNAEVGNVAWPGNSVMVTGCCQAMGTCRIIRVDSLSTVYQTAE